MATRNLKVIDALNPAANTVSRAVDTLGMKDVTMYLRSPASTSAGTLQLEGSPTGSQSAEPSQRDWVAIGAALAFGVADTTVAVSATQAHRYVRVRVTVSFAGGASNTIVYVTLCGKSDGAWHEGGT
jgi:hypothetical protein